MDCSGWGLTVGILSSSWNASALSHSHLQNRPFFSSNVPLHSDQYILLLWIFKSHFVKENLDGQMNFFPITLSNHAQSGKTSTLWAMAPPPGPIW